MTMFVADDVDDIFKNTPQLITVDEMNLPSLNAHSTRGAIRLEERTTPDA